MLLGLMLQAGLSLVTVKLAIIGLLIFFASPTATHALARAGAARAASKPLLGRAEARHRSADHQRAAGA